jgi:hypothetical protein
MREKLLGELKALRGNQDKNYSGSVDGRGFEKLLLVC